MALQTDWVPTRTDSSPGEQLSDQTNTQDSSKTIVHSVLKVGPTWLGIIVVPLLLLLVPIAYQTGVIQTLGYESKGLKGSGFTSTSSGYTLGLKTMYFTKGQEVVADYDVDITAGSLVIRMYQYTGIMDPDTHFRHQVKSDEKGQARFLINESGFYKLVVEGSVLGNSPPGAGYQIDYTATWGVR